MKAFFVSFMITLSIASVFAQGTQKILIINSFDAQSMKARKNKKQLFAELADSLKSMLKIEFERRQSCEVIIIPGIINNSQKKDSVYVELINKYAASKAIVINDLNAYFVQTDVEVTKEADG